MIGWYVHHHGVGHSTRFVAVASRMRTPVTGIGTGPAPAGWDGDWLAIPPDAGDGADDPVIDPTASGVLHWAPLGHRGLAERVAAITSWVVTTRPTLLVSDVSVEIALLTRLTGTPVVVAAMLGDRTDRPHRSAYDLAQALLAPWPDQVARPDWPASWRDKTLHTGAFSRFDDRQVTRVPDRAATGNRVLMLWGSGGTDVTEADLAAAREATPGWTWTYRLGRTTAEAQIGGAEAEPVWDSLMAADVVVVHGGHNAVAGVAAARRPAVVVAQRRPHREQEDRAEVLTTLGLAAGLSAWPEPDRWPALLENARRRGGDGWSHWSPGDGAVRAAQALDRLARR